MSGTTLEKLSEELVFALDICEKAARLAMQHFQAGVSFVDKPDGSPVTVADKECERLIRTAIAEKFPGDAMLGEEEGETAGSATADGGSKGVVQKSTRRWIIDPIDGTYGFGRGTAVWSTLLALEVDGEITLGVVSAPAAQDVYYAEKGRGAFKNGVPIHVSKYDKLNKAQFEFGALSRILQAGLWTGFTKVIESTYRQRGSGDYLGFARVFDGQAEAHLEVGVQAWDIAPMKIIVEEAGGRYTDLDGEQSIYKGSCLVSNGLLHDEFLKLLHTK
jgi:histidinol-phosphatase